jgi:sec-independent protein translocase protein TatA
MGLDNPIHIAFLVVILLLVFGAKRLPELGRSLGTGMREFKQSVTGETQAAEKPAQQPMLAAAAQPAAPAETPVAQPAAPVAQAAPAAAQPAAPVAQPAPAEAAPVEQQQHS